MRRIGIARLPVHRSGLVDLDALRTLLAQGSPALVSIMLANNETGAIQPVAEAADLVHEAGGLLHVDAVQAIGKIPIDIRKLNTDLLSISAHKIGGPKGMGALVLAENQIGPSALIRGGGQEQGRRAGTENASGIAGFGAAAMAAETGRDWTEMARVQTLRNRLEDGLRQTRGGVIFSQETCAPTKYDTFRCPGLESGDGRDRIRP